MTKCYRAKDGMVAFWEKPASDDIDVIMHPFYYPEQHMDEVYFHSNLRYLANVLEQDVVINHTSLAGKTGSVAAGAPGFGMSAQLIANGDIRSSSIDLLTHGFGYPPLTFVLYDGVILSGMTTLQTHANGSRYASSWSDNTKAGLREIAFSTTSALPAVSCTYKVLCFRQFDADMSKPLLQLKPGEEIICFGHGKITQDDRPVRVPNVVGDAEWYVPISPIIDTKNGAIRTLSPISGKVDRGLYTGSLFQVDAVLMTNS